MLETTTGAPLGLFELFGVAGAGLYVGNYTLLVTQRTSTDRPANFMVNLAAAIPLPFSLSQAFNLGSALIQLFFLVKSLIGFVSRLQPIRRLARHRHIRSPALQAQPIRWSRPGLDLKKA